MTFKQCRVHEWLQNDVEQICKCYWGCWQQRGIGSELRALHYVTQRMQFDADVQLSRESGKHKMESKEEDISAVVAVLKEQAIYKITVGRCYAAFPSFNGNPLHNLTSKHLSGWIWEHKTKYHCSQMVKKKNPDPITYRDGILNNLQLNNLRLLRILI